MKRKSGGRIKSAGGGKFHSISIKKAFGGFIAEGLFLLFQKVNAIL